jgi:hypothetical protein
MGSKGFRSVQRLNLALFVDAQNQRALGRRQVQPDDVAHLLDKKRIGGKLEGLGAMRLEVESLPYPMNRRGREARRFRHRAQAPVCRVLRRRLQSSANDFGDLVVADLARRPRSRFVHQTVDAIVRKPLTCISFDLI